MTVTKKLLIAILVVAALFRVVWLWQGDLTGSDEIFYGFRAIGMLDYDNAPKQSTPLEWFDPINRANKIIPYPADLPKEGGIPWWTKLSFHDHPPLVFLAQNISMGIFGENKFGFRLPSAVAGVISVYLIYLIGRKLFPASPAGGSEKAGLVSAALYAVTVNAVHNARLGIQEPILIALMLAAIYFFLLADQAKKYLLAVGVLAGLAMLAKYNATVLAPIFLIYILLFRREWLKEKFLWLGLLLAIIIFSPVIIYNLNLYLSVGHFDFQLSYLLGQNPEVWQSAPGKEAAGNLLSRLKDFVPAMAKANSWPFLIISAIGLGWLLWETFRKRSTSSAFLLICVISTAMLIIGVIGPAPRFLAMLTPFLALIAGKLMTEWPSESRKASQAALVLILLWEIFYTINTDILPYPIGAKHFTFSRLRYENYRWGYNELDNWLAGELAGKFPAFVLNQKYQFLDKIIDLDLSRAERSGNQPYSALFIYDNNLQDAGKFWSFDRLQVYHGWPVVKTEGYAELQKFELPQHITYFVTPAEKILVKENSRLTLDGPKFEQSLLAKGLLPIVIKNQKGEPAFRIYKF
ncbi:MAG: glycosyltransferase family 39 protein [Patescibacteria group bacterium]